ncbi:MAG: methylglyoxal synthase [Candidatus Marinimicrobia bacterium]|nr:methylglyoxal synthase [Candidatus Neomarinimicrobiota bacterium]
MRTKTIGLVAHDNRKKDLVEWFNFNIETLIRHKFVCTGTTGTLLKKEVEKRFGSNFNFEDKFTILKSGPLGGDQQLGSMIAEGKINILIFLWDPMEPMPHDVDVKALLRLATLYNIPIACNRSTADFIISSPLFESDYKPIIKDYTSYLKRRVDLN